MTTSDPPTDKQTKISGSYFISCFCLLKKAHKITIFILRKRIHDVHLHRYYRIQFF
jgi:hypothetical protein